MSKLLYSATMSLDGFIAGGGDDMSWLSGLLGEGVRLYEHRGGTRDRLEPREPGRTGPLSLWYRVGATPPEDGNEGAEESVGRGTQPPPSSA